MKIYISGKDIKVGQLLKIMGLIPTGGAAKHFLENNNVVYKDKKVIERGKKILPSTMIWINDEAYQILPKEK